MASLFDKPVAIIATVFFLMKTVTLSDDTIKGKALHRERRAIVFSSLPTIQLSIGVTTPVSVPARKVLISSGFQVAYGLPTNATVWHTAPNIMRKRETSNMTLQNIYFPLESFLEGYGFHGRACVLRSICEAAHTPFHFEEMHLLEEVMHSILTPSLDVTPEEGYCSANPHILENLPVEKQYLAAECLGKSKGNCQTAYRGCPKSPLHFISQEVNMDILVE